MIGFCGMGDSHEMLLSRVGSLRILAFPWRIPGSLP